MTRDPALDPAIDPSTLSRDEWRAILSPIEFAILRESATERPGQGRYLYETRPGAFHCAGCGQKLYGAQHKFHSGCGWPSFFQEIEDDALTTIIDTTHGMVRTEMRCSRCDGHMGHIFKDAPQTPTGTRHCVNGYAIMFVGVGEDLTDAVRRHRAENAPR